MKSLLRWDPFRATRIWDPFTGLREMQSEMDRLFNRVLGTERDLEWTPAGRSCPSAPAR